MAFRAKRSIIDIACQQVLLHDASVLSVQWLVVPERFAPLVTPRFLLDSYLKLVRKFTLSLIRPIVDADGVRFRLLDSSLALLSFGAPEFFSDEISQGVELHINGGILVQPRECYRGRFSIFTQKKQGGLRITLQLSDYCPLLLGSSRPSPLRRLLYRVTQAYIHKVVTVRYLSDVYSQLTGEKADARLIRVRVKEGRET